MLAAFAAQEDKAHARDASGTAPSLVQPFVEPLTQRERTVLALMADGLTNDEIARRLIVATGTVKAHTAAIYRKLDAGNRTEAVTIARRHHLLP